MSKTLREYHDGEVIFAEGDGAAAAYVLVEGNVELQQSSSAGPVTLAFLQPGETFGDMSVIEGKPHQATARAVGPAVVEIVSRDEFLGSLRGAPLSALGLIQSLIGRLRGMNARAVQPAGTPPAPPFPKVGLLSGLFGDSGAIDVRVADFPGGDPDLPRRITQLLSRRPGIRARVLKVAIDAAALAQAADENAPVELVDPSPQEKAARHAAAAADAARLALRKAKGDLLIWGHVPAPGATLILTFTPAIADDEDRVGLFADTRALCVPATADPAWSELIYAVVLAAANPRDEPVLLHLRQLLPRAMDDARDFITSLPYGLTTAEKAAALIAFATVTAQTAALHGSGHLYNQAAALYRAGLNGLKKESDPLAWALAQRNLGYALHGLADAGGDGLDADTTPDKALDAAADAYRAASQVLSKAILPLPWAAVQNRLGVALYKLDAKTQDAEILKHTLAAYQSALQVFSPQQSPLRWAEVMHNLAQAAQVLGGQMRNRELLQKAVDACRAALRVRRKETHPFLWASTQNNLGSALFLLGRTLEDRDELESAAQSFSQVRDFHALAGNANPAAIAGRNLAHVEKMLAALDKKAQAGRPPRMKWEPPEDPAEPAPATEQAVPAAKPEST